MEPVSAARLQRWGFRPSEAGKRVRGGAAQGWKAHRVASRRNKAGDLGTAKPLAPLVQRRESSAERAPSTQSQVSTARNSTPARRLPVHGGAAARGLESTPSSSTRTGRFGRMFRHLPVYAHAPETLIALGKTMLHREERENGMLDKPVEVADKEDENRSTLGDTDDGPLRLPAGYTYFGQFVDHDITFDPASSLTRQNDPDALM